MKALYTKLDIFNKVQIWVTLLPSLIWICYIINEIVSNEYDNDFGTIFLLLIPIGICAVNILNVLFQLPDMIKKKSYFSVIPLILSIGIFSILITINYLLIMSKEKVVNELQATPNWIYLDRTKQLKECDHDNYDIELKNNNKILCSEIHKFSSSYYWGSYTYKRDTIFFNIKKGFIPSDTAVITGDTLRFNADTTKYIVYKSVY